MKKGVTILCLLAACSFRADAPKTLKVEATQQEWEGSMFRHLEFVKSYLDKTHLPHDEVKSLLGHLDSAENFLLPQLRQQLADTTSATKKK